MTEEDNSSMTTLYAIIGGLVGFAILLLIVAQLIVAAVSDDDTAEARRELIGERLAAVGQVNTGETPEQPAQTQSGQASQEETGGEQAGEPLSGQAVYDQQCSTCHAAGVAGAPMVDATDDWQQRLDERGREGLHSNAINGYKGMPAKGGDSSLSDDEVTNAVDYMLEQAGL